MERAPPTSLETHLCEALHAFLANNDDPEAEGSTGIRDVLSTLERFIPELLREYCRGWPAHESLDGILPVRCSQLGERGVEVVGTAIFIRDQNETPVYIRLRLHPVAGALDELLCHLGEVDSTTGDLVRIANGSSHSLKTRSTLPDRLGEVVWKYTVKLGATAEATCRSTTTCDECGCLYCGDTSAMAALCPECAHQLYGYARCDHEFRGSRCARCFWDGSVSEYLADRD